MRFSIVAPLTVVLLRTGVCHQEYCRPVTVAGLNLNDVSGFANYQLAQERRANLIESYFPLYQFGLHLPLRKKRRAACAVIDTWCLQPVPVVPLYFEGY
jgi:hypothetical protein